MFLGKIREFVKMSHCADTVTCPGGNCPGCQDGVLWCADPRCSPFCQECAAPPYFDGITNATFALIVLTLLLLLFVIWYLYGPPLFRPHTQHIEVPGCPPYRPLTCTPAPVCPPCVPKACPPPPCPPTCTPSCPPPPCDPCGSIRGY